MTPKLLALVCLTAGLLAVVPSAQAQSAEIWVYATLAADASLVYGFAESDLWYPCFQCQGGDYDSCWLDYDIYIDGSLKNEGTTVGTYSWYEYCNGAWVEAWQEDPSPGMWQWDVLAFSNVNWHWVYYEQYYEEWSDYVYGDAWLDALVSGGEPQISVSEEQSVDDGGTGYFYVTLEAGSPTLYSWSYGYEPSSGNYPNVDFSDPWSSSTLTDGHWYASPDDACSAGRQAQYSITARVEFDHPLLTLYDTTSLTVVLPVIGGATYAPSLIEHISRGLDGGVWKVLSETYFVRPDPPVLKAFTSQSQFYEKVVAHENVHVDQYTPGGDYHLYEDLYSATAARNEIIGLTATTLEALDDKIVEAYNKWLEGQDTLDNSRSATAEAQAFAVSDGKAPQYKYQSQCGGL